MPVFLPFGSVTEAQPRVWLADRELPGRRGEAHYGGNLGMITKSVGWRYDLPRAATIDELTIDMSLDSKQGGR